MYSEINLNLPSGADSQFNVNRTGVLCGSCLPGLSLSLGSSHCISCPHYWPGVSILITIAAFFAGFALLFVLKVLDLTVTAGTINGLIFCANIIHAFNGIFLPFKQPTFATVFISWLNFEIGIGTCFFEGMDTYSKVWIEFLFPVYLIILNLLVVYCTAKYSSRSKICHRMNSNPLPVLATVILLSFINLLTTASKALSFVLITYPHGSKRALWLLDANIPYCEGKHIAIFLVGIVVFFLNVLYSLILTAWHLFDNSSFCKYLHCLLRYNLRVYLKQLLFYYHAPYADRFQFWSGFLLLLRIALLVVSIVSTGTGGDPQISVISVIIATSLLMLIRILIREKSLYGRPCIDYFEMAFNFNLITFAVLTLHIADPDNQITLANISVSVTFILFIGILIDRFYTRLFKQKLFRSLWYRLKQSPKEITIHTPLLESNDDTEQLEYILKFDQYREPLIDHDSSDSSEELASVPFPQRIHDKTNPKTVEAPGDHDEPTLSQNIGGTSTNQPISSTIAEVPIQELDKLNQEMFDSSSLFDLDKERENQEYCIEEDKVVCANQSDLHELSFSVPLETSSEIQENRQQELLSRSCISSSFPFPNLFETTTFEHAHSLMVSVMVYP